jgi:EAL domain-containing protein (putative c-di-GMP-specific phosphodiesterase class I)
LRWVHPERGDVPTADFIPLAEETGLIVPIGEWVLQHACVDASAWPAQIGVAVNLSPAQFKSAALVKGVFGALAAAHLAPSRLELDVTESITLRDGKDAFETLHRLRNLGVKIAMDGFGTGYASLSNLQKFPFDKIKIDRSFVSGLSEANAGAIAMVRSAARLGIALGMATAAEGVETPEQLEIVRREGYTEMQGFLFSRPIPAHEIAKFLAERKDAVAHAPDASEFTTATI